MEFGYARVSTAVAKGRKRQHVDNQTERLRAYGIPQDRIFVDDGKSGKLKSRPAWDQCFSHLREGDVLIVTKLDRIGRSLINLVDIANEIRRRGAHIKCLDSGEVDTTSATGELFFNLMASMAQWEARMVQERTLEGLEHARERHGGTLPKRGPSVTPDQIATAKTLATTTDMSAGRIAEVIGVSRATLYRHVNIAELRELVNA